MAEKIKRLGRERRRELEEHLGIPKHLQLKAPGEMLSDIELWAGYTQDPLALSTAMMIGEDSGTYPWDEFELSDAHQQRRKAAVTKAKSNLTRFINGSKWGRLMPSKRRRGAWLERFANKTTTE